MLSRLLCACSARRRCWWSTNPCASPTPLWTIVSRVSVACLCSLPVARVRLPCLSAAALPAFCWSAAALLQASRQAHAHEPKSTMGAGVSVQVCERHPHPAEACGQRQPTHSRKQHSPMLRTPGCSALTSHTMQRRHANQQRFLNMYTHIHRGGRRGGRCSRGSRAAGGTAARRGPCGAQESARRRQVCARGGGGWWRGGADAHGALPV